MEIFFLGAAEEVTGSCYLINVNNEQILVDCGMIQGNHSDAMRNHQEFPFDPHEISAVVLTHAHIDHSGRLPLLIRSGFSGTIYTHHATRDLCHIMLHDAAHIQVYDTETENKKRLRKHLRPLAPLYTAEDVDHVLHQFKTLSYGETIEISPGCIISLSDAGHILGSAIIEMWLNEKGTKRKVVFSGDLGHKSAPMLRDPHHIDKADFVIMESTYGDRNHRSWDDTWQELENTLARAQESGGNLLVPAFTVGRVQDLLYIFHKNFHKWGLGRWNIFLDSPMGIKTTKAYAKHSNLYDREALEFIEDEGSPFSLVNLTLCQSVKESMRINRVKSGAIIIAGSGMCDGGRIRHHIKHNIWRRDCHIMFTGYQARNTLGRQLIDGVGEINLWGETIKVGATVHTIGGLSAHADQSGLLSWYGHIESHPPVALTHGETKAIDTLAEKIGQAFSAQAIKPKLASCLDLQKMQLMQASS